MVLRLHRGPGPNSETPAQLQDSRSRPRVFRVGERRASVQCDGFLKTAFPLPQRGQAEKRPAFLWMDPQGVFKRSRRLFEITQVHLQGAQVGPGFRIVPAPVDRKQVMAAGLLQTALPMEESREGDLRVRVHP